MLVVDIGLTIALCVVALAVGGGIGYLAFRVGFAQKGRVGELEAALEASRDETIKHR